MKKVTLGTLWFKNEDHLTASITENEVTNVYIKDIHTSINDFLNTLGIGRVVYTQDPYSAIEATATIPTAEVTAPSTPATPAPTAPATPAPTATRSRGGKKADTKLEAKIEAPLEYVPYSAKKGDTEPYKLARTQALATAFAQWTAITLDLARAEFPDQLKELSAELMGKPFMTADGKNVHPSVQATIEKIFPKEMEDDEV